MQRFLRYLTGAAVLALACAALPACSSEGDGGDDSASTDSGDTSTDTPSTQSSDE